MHVKFVICCCILFRSLGQRQYVNCGAEKWDKMATHNAFRNNGSFGQNLVWSFSILLSRQPSLRVSLSALWITHGINEADTLCILITLVVVLISEVWSSWYRRDPYSPIRARQLSLQVSLSGLWNTHLAWHTLHTDHFGCGSDLIIW